MAHPAYGRLEAYPLAPKTTHMATEAELVQYIDLKLAALGHPTARLADGDFLAIARPLLRNYPPERFDAGQSAVPGGPAHSEFPGQLFEEMCARTAPRNCPANTFRAGSGRAGARDVAAAARRHFHFAVSEQSYRVPQGILHNPKSDRRTTQGIFHIVEGGLPVPADKQAVPKQTFAALLAAAFKPPARLDDAAICRRPRRARSGCSCRCCCGRLCARRPSSDPQKTMEIRFFAPGSLVSNLDFVESIFGNAGDPYLPENDAALDAMHWTGHTGCVIVAPHLAGIKKKDVGLPHEKDATERQRRDGMCWRDPDEPYNGGGSFKVACRDERGVMVTIIADNYYGYCKKEVKTQISYRREFVRHCARKSTRAARSPSPPTCWARISARRMRSA